MVPGSTLMYGSSLIMLTERPRASSIAPRQAEVMPLPREDTTPPVMKMNRVICIRRTPTSCRPVRSWIQNQAEPRRRSSMGVDLALEARCLVAPGDGITKYQMWLGLTSHS